MLEVRKKLRRFFAGHEIFALLLAPPCTTLSETKVDNDPGGFVENESSSDFGSSKQVCLLAFPLYVDFEVGTSLHNVTLFRIGHIFSYIMTCYCTLCECMEICSF